MVSDLTEMFSALEGCCLHKPQWRPDDVLREITWHGDRQTGCESSSIVIVRLKPQPGQQWPGDFGLLTQSEDYTGHGCQCNSMTVREPTLAKLLPHLDDYELLRLLGRES